MPRLSSNQGGNWHKPHYLKQPSAKIPQCKSRVYLFLHLLDNEGGSVMGSSHSRTQQAGLGDFFGSLLLVQPVVSEVE